MIDKSWIFLECSDTCIGNNVFVLNCIRMINSREFGMADLIVTIDYISY